MGNLRVAILRKMEIWTNLRRGRTESITGARVAFLCHTPAILAHYVNVWRFLDSESFVIILCRELENNEIDERNARRWISQELALQPTILKAQEAINSTPKFELVITNHFRMGSVEIRSRNIKYLFLNLSRSRRLRGQFFFREILVIVREYAKAFRCGSRVYERPRQVRVGPEVELPVAVGVRQIRFMYGLDISPGWSAQEWNHNYDAFLCHGPVDAKLMSDRFGKPTYQIGYPKYDRSIDARSDQRTNTLESLGLDDSRPYLYWMSTTNGDGECTSSIQKFAATLAEIEEFDIVCRPHPISVARDPKLAIWLESLGIFVDVDPVRDTGFAMKFADAVLCDYGGSPFGGLYLRRRVIFLALPEAVESKTAKDSTDQLLRSLFPTVTLEDALSIPDLLNDEQLWKEIMAEAEDLRGSLFPRFEHSCGAEVARVLERLLEDAG